MGQTDRLNFFEGVDAIDPISNAPRGCMIVRQSTGQFAALSATTEQVVPFRRPTPIGRMGVEAPVFGRADTAAAA